MQQRLISRRHARYRCAMTVLETSHTRHFDLLMLCARIGYSPPAA